MNTTDDKTMQEWLHQELSKVLEFEIPEEMARDIINIEARSDLEQHLKTLLNYKNPKHKKFSDQLLIKLKGHWQENLQSTGASHVLQPIGYRKSSEEESYFVGKLDKKNKGNKENKLPQSSRDTPLKKEVSEESSKVSPNVSKKRPKFVSLYSQEGQNKDVILIKGRHLCNCQASKHQLVNNCLKCGRIVCVQEGAGPCFFCGNLVCTPEEMKIIQRNSKQSGQLYRKLMKQGKPEDLDAAVAHRNRLLDYDRTSEKRTKVIDDESDYYSSNSVWLSETEREKLRKQENAERERKHASRKDARFTLDFAGRQVVEENPLNSDFFSNEEDLEVLQEFQASGKLGSIIMDPGIDFPELVFQDSSRKATFRSNAESFLSKYGRVQDREYLEMSDNGRCLSMHQPWASLLVAGIKMHEGRNWYSSHRGRLWIAAAAKVPDQECIEKIESAYRVLKEDVQFPKHYPTGCLLGCVTMMDCLAQEEYQERFPQGESDSPFVFICEDPCALPVRFPMHGQHKIYQLDPKIHTAAQKSLQHIAKIQAEKSA